MARLGLVLSGGGARGAYQAGVLLAIAEIRSQNPELSGFRVLTGVSAGAINVAYLAAHYENELEAARELAQLWKTISSEQVFRTDPISLGRIGAGWLADTTLGALRKRKRARSLLDTEPLRELISKRVPFQKIPENISAGHFDAFAVMALNYSTAHSISFIQSSQPGLGWTRSRRRSEDADINTDHIMASAAIPLFFPPVRVQNDYFGDGCLRNTAPLSSAVHLGSDRLMVISVRRPEEKAKHVAAGLEPSIARVLGVMLNALLMDAIEFDMERLARINSTLDYIPASTRQDLQLKKVSSLWIRPSEDIGFLASGQFDRLPTVVRYLMAGLGSSNEASELTSYLLFDPDYCGKLVDLGYQDAWAQSEEIIRFLSEGAAPDRSVG